MKYPIRLDKLISQTTDWSRKEVKRLAHKELITVNGTVEKSTDTKINESDVVVCDGETIGDLTPRYFMLNKPVGFISATKDREHLTVLEFIEEPRKDNLSVAGRLDIDTTGLVLLTDDGQWLHRVISPKHHCVKTYLVETAKPLDEKQIAKLESGVWLNNEKTRTKPATVEVIDEYHYRLSITEGRYHQVKRMFAAIENHVESLHREQIGAIILDPDLQPGEYRALTDSEVASID
ncbi:MAG: 16S rRNA pseudouridine(516) synthase RsuA [Gammaproteobacteria bacterium]|nr:16S rRNA pseudouridine(516) synthase RsuA [Gammaproteobacteria bacterium]